MTLLSTRFLTMFFSNDNVVRHCEDLLLIGSTNVCLGLHLFCTIQYWCWFSLKRQHSRNVAYLCTIQYWCWSSLNGQHSWNSAYLCAIQHRCWSFLNGHHGRNVAYLWRTAASRSDIASRSIVSHDPGSA